MDQDEEKRRREEEVEQEIEKKRRAKAKQEQEEAEEEWKEGRQTSRATIDEDEEQPEEEQDKDDKDNKKEKKSEDNDEENSEDNGEKNSENKDDKGKEDSKEEDKSNDGKKPDEGQQQNAQSSSQDSRRQSQNRGQQDKSKSSDKKPESNQPSKKPEGNKPQGQPESNVPKPQAQPASSGTANQAANRTAQKGAQKGAQTASKAASKGGTIAKIGTVGIVVLIIIIVLGIIFFFVTMPGLVVGKIGQAINGLLTAMDNFITGNAVANSVTKEQMVKAAMYLEDMGYDLQGTGFLTEEGVDKISGEATGSFFNTIWEELNNNGEDLEDASGVDIENFDTQDFKKRAEEEQNDNIKEVYISKKASELDLTNDSDVRKSIVMIKNLDGDVEYVKSKYLYMYLMAENSTYLVKNDNVKLWERIKKVTGGSNTADGAGLIWFYDEDKDGKEMVADYIKNWPDDYEDEFIKPEGWFGSNKYTVDKDKKQMTIYNDKDGAFKSTFYTYNMAGWVSQYGMPLQLSLALHLSSMAPDFAYEVAQNAVENTKVQIGLVEVKGVTITLKFKIDMDGDGTPEEYRLEKKYGVHIHTNDDGSDEEGYDSEEEANSQGGSDEDYMNERDEAEGKFANLEEALEDFKQRMDNITNNGSNKEIAGSLVYIKEDENTYVGDFKYNPDRLGQSITDDIEIDDYAISSTNQYIKELGNIITTYKKDGDSEPIAKKEGSSIKIEKDEEEIREIVKKYFKLEDIQNSFFDDPCTIVHQEGGDMYYLGYKKWGLQGKENVSWNQFVQNAEYQEVKDVKFNNTDDFVDEKIEQYREAVTYQDGTDTNYYCVVFDNGNAISEIIIDNNNNVEKYQGVFYRSNIDSWFDIIFLGKEPEYRSDWFDSFIDWLCKIWPVRLYYRLVADDGSSGPVNENDKDGEPFVEFDVDDGFFYSTSNKSYWEDGAEKGWFWRKSIPKKIYNAVKRTQEKFKWDQEQLADEEASQSEENSQNSNQENNNQQENEGFTYNEVTDQSYAVDPTPEEVQNMFDKAYGDLGLNFNGLNTRGLTKYVPIVMKVLNHWYEDLYYDDPQCYEWEDASGSSYQTKYLYIPDDSSYDDKGVIDAADAEMLYIQEDAPGHLEQIAKPRTENTGDYLDALIDGKKYKGKQYDGLYYIYDGVRASEEKKKIDFSNMAVDAIAMLEQIQGEDAQQIIRMFKLYMASRGIKFVATPDTEFKQKICSKVIEYEEGDYDCLSNLLTEGNAGYVLRAEIPPAQYGFAASENEDGKRVYVVAPVDGTIVYRSDDCVGIEISDTTGKYDKYVFLISGFRVYDSIDVGNTVKDGDKIGTTARRDIKMVLRDENGSPVSNSYEKEETNVENELYDEHQGNVTSAVNGKRNAEDIRWVVKQLKKAVFNDEKDNENNPRTEYEIASSDEFVDALIDMQDTYGIDPLWALAVFHWESHCGACYAESEHRIANISGWTGSKYQTDTVTSEDHEFGIYGSYKDAILDFGQYSNDMFGHRLSNVDEYEEYNDMKLFEGAKQKDYPTYLQLKVVLSSKGV